MGRDIVAAVVCYGIFVVVFSNLCDRIEKYHESKLNKINGRLRECEQPLDFWWYFETIFMACFSIILVVLMFVAVVAAWT